MDYLDIAGWIVAGLVAAYAVYQRVTGGSESDALDGLYTREKVVREAVAAAEQLWLTGQIPSTATGGKDPRFLWALARVQEFYPDLSESQLEMAIEAAVYWAKKTYAELSAGE